MSVSTNKKFCPIIKPVELLGDSWTLMIIKSLLNGPKRFNELKSEIDDVNNRTLSARLKSLGEKGILIRRVGTQNPPTVTYYLTPLGKGAEPILKSIEDFGNKFLC